MGAWFIRFSKTRLVRHLLLIRSPPPPFRFFFFFSFFLFTSGLKGFLRYTSYKVSIMTSSPTPDIFNTQPSQQRLNDTYDYDGSAQGNGRQQYQFITSPPISAQSPYNPLNMNPSPLKMKPLRGGLPTVRLSPSSTSSLLSRLTFIPQQWLDNSAIGPENRSLSPNNNSDFSSSGGSPPMGHLTGPPGAPSTPGQNPDDEIIPTAIVIKNIPFNVKRETLLDIIVSPSSVIGP